MGESPQAGTWIYRPWHLYSLSIRIAVYRSEVPPERMEAAHPTRPEPVSAQGGKDTVQASFGRLFRHKSDGT